MRRYRLAALVLALTFWGGSPGTAQELSEGGGLDETSQHLSSGEDFAPIDEGHRVDHGDEGAGGRWATPLGWAALVVGVLVFAMLLLALPIALLPVGPGGGLFLLALLVRIVAPDHIYNWYSIPPGQTPADAFGSIAPAFICAQEVLLLILPHTVALFDAVALLVTVASALHAPLVYRLARTIGLSGAAAGFAGGIMALWPVLVLMGTSDAQHPIAMTFWLVGAVALFMHRTLPSALLLGVTAILIVATRFEAALWPLAWLPLLFLHQKPDRAALVRGLTIIGCVGASAPFLSHLAEHVDSGVQVLGYLWTPIYVVQGLTQFHLLYQIMNLGFVLGVVMGLYRAPRRTLVVLAAIAILSSPNLLGGKVPGNPMTVRYYLPITALLALLMSFVVEHAWRVTRGVVPGLLVLGLVTSMALDARLVFAEQGQFVYRREFTFLRTAAGEAEGSARLCLIDPRVNHRWPGEHKDFDTSFSAGGDGMDRYMGISQSVLLLPDDRVVERGCDIYYESSVCFLAPIPVSGNPDAPQDILRVKQLCQNIRRKLEPRPIARVDVYGVSFTIPFEGPRVPLSLYRVKKGRGTDEALTNPQARFGGR